MKTLASKRIQAMYLCLVLAGVLSLCAQLNAQAKYLGAFSGVVTDAAGARVPNANVAAKDQQF
jgi:hypothetical protein